MNVLITGGTGLIGLALTADLLKEGHNVTILTRAPDRMKLQLPDVKLQKWDGESAAGWGHLVKEMDAIVNLAGENISAGLWTAQRKQAIRISRVNAGRAVVEAIRSAQHIPAVLVQASGIGYYGIKDPSLLDESAPPGDDFLSSVSQDWEGSTQPVEALGVRRVIIRSGVVFSRKALALERMLLPFRLFVGGPLGSGKQWLSWIHLEDEVRAIRFLIGNQKASGAFNLVAQPVTNGQFARIAGRVMHRPSLIRVPAFILKLALGEMSTIVLDGQRASSHKLTDLGFQFRFYTLDEALKDLVEKNDYPQTKKRW